MSNQSVIQHNLSFKKSDLAMTKLKTVTPKIEEHMQPLIPVELKTYFTLLKTFKLQQNFAINRLNFDNLKKYFKKILGHGLTEMFRLMVLRTFFSDQRIQNAVIETCLEKAIKKIHQAILHHHRPKRRSNQVPQEGQMYKTKRQEYIQS